MRVLILGYGESTKAVIKYLENEEYYIFDENKKVKNQITLKELCTKLPLFDLCIRSPGISSLSEAYVLAKMLSKELISEIEFGLRRLKTKHIIGITGTNGKTTTALMINTILKEKYNTYLLGNIGTPLCEKIDDIKKEDIVILELSSFQLEDTYSLDFEVAIITNLEPNHLDKTLSKYTYYASKMKIFNSDTKIKIFEKSDDNISEYKNTSIKINLYKNPIKNIHANTALYVGKIYGIEEEIGSKALSSFSFPKFRQEEWQYKGYLIINDSKSTSISATKECLNAYKEKEKILILGGINKSGDFSTLRYNDTIEIYLFGKDGRMIQKQTGGIYFETLEEVIRSIKNKIDRRIIMFSPGCSSFDQYSNYIQRGEEFERLIKKWF